MQEKYFITGTDTDVGKTFVTAQLLKEFNAKGLKTVALKPVASGCEDTALGWANSDAVTLKQAASVTLPLQDVNPFAFNPFIAPHLAAQQAGVALSVENIMAACQRALKTDCDALLVEGAGGWRVPLNDRETFADLAKQLGFPVILVVGIQLGCINHALLTYEAMCCDQVPIKGWIANMISGNTAINEDNVTTLQQRLAIPLLKTVPFNE